MYYLQLSLSEAWALAELGKNFRRRKKLTKNVIAKRSIGEKK